ncbi:MAG: Transposase, family [Actinomycetia bacterium]|nr:Transposase, family [Actinomycetes bacterium]
MMTGCAALRPSSGVKTDLPMESVATDEANPAIDGGGRLSGRSAEPGSPTGLIILADKGYQGTGDHVLTPYKGRNKPEPQKDANRSPACLRGPGERANARLTTWHILRRLRCFARLAEGSKKAYVSITLHSARGHARFHRRERQEPLVRGQVA